MHDGHPHTCPTCGAPWVHMDGDCTYGNEMECHDCFIFGKPATDSGYNDKHAMLRAIFPAQS